MTPSSVFQGDVAVAVELARQVNRFLRHGTLEEPLAPFTSLNDDFVYFLFPFHEEILHYLYVVMPPGRLIGADNANAGALGLFLLPSRQ